MAVNGEVYDHESLAMEMPGTGELVTLSEVNYDAGKEVDIKTDTRGVPRGQVRKAFKGEFSCSVARVEYDALAESTSETGILGAEPMPVTLVYGNDGQEPTQDDIEVKIDKVDLTSKEGEEVMVKLSGKQTKIPKLAGHDVYVVPR